MQKRFLLLGVTALAVAFILSFGSGAATQSATSNIRAVIGTKTSTWRGNVTGICDASKSPKTKAISVTFYPTSNSEGTWKSNDYNIFNMSALCTPTQLVIGGHGTGSSKEYNLLGTYSGSYKIVGNMVLASKITYPDDNPSTGKFTVLGEYDNGNLYFYDNGGKSPGYVAVVTK